MKKRSSRAMSGVLRPDDIVEVSSNEGWDQPDNLEVAVENMMMIKELIDGKKRAFMVNVHSSYISKEVIAYYYKVDLGEVARALVVTSFSAKVLGNLYLKMTKNATNENNRSVPVKLFSNRKDAISWLVGQIEISKQV